MSIAEQVSEKIADGKIKPEEEVIFILRDNI